jgi:hypothetical protein
MRSKQRPDVSNHLKADVILEACQFENSPPHYIAEGSSIVAAVSKRVPWNKGRYLIEVDDALAIAEQVDL